MRRYIAKEYRLLKHLQDTSHDILLQVALGGNRIVLSALDRVLNRRQDEY
jgi:hypothetical protein